MTESVPEPPDDSPLFRSEFLPPDDRTILAMLTVAPVGTRVSKGTPIVFDGERHLPVIFFLPQRD